MEQMPTSGQGSVAEVGGRQIGMDTIQQTSDARRAGWRWRAVLVLVVVLVLGGALRWLNEPRADEIRDVDEISYSECGPLLWEGVTPGFTAAPNGPQTWLGWGYAALASARQIIHPNSAVASAPAMMRPFLAVDTGLFGIYRDLSGLRRFFLTEQFLIALAGLYGAYRLGAAYGGHWGALLIGGLAAVLPVFVDFAEMTRPYSDAWSFGLLALGFAAVPGRRGRAVWTGIFLGLAVASRVEMVLLLAVICWQFIYRPEPGARWKAPATAALIASVVTLIVAPWLLIYLPGNLRTILTVRGAGQQRVFKYPRLATLADLLWYQGLGPLLVLLAVGLALVPKGKRAWIAVLAIFASASLASLFTGPYEPFRYSVFSVMVLFVLSAVLSGSIIDRWPKFAVLVVAAVLALPLAQSGVMVARYHRDRVPMDVTGWIERHVPRGSRVVLNAAHTVHTVLPTPQAADAIWDEVTNEQAWRRKFERGVSRFGLSEAYIPRALSEEDMALDRAARRRFFILGGNPNAPQPRYDLHLVGATQTFGIHDVSEDFAKSGGVLVWCDFFTPVPANLGQPLVQRLNPDGHGVRIWCSPDLRAKLLDQGRLDDWSNP
jgi:hypothetical protein